MSNKDLPAPLARLRKWLRTNKIKIAHLANPVGISRKWLGMILRGKVSPTREVQEGIILHAGVSEELAQELRVFWGVCEELPIEFDLRWLRENRYSLVVFIMGDSFHMAEVTRQTAEVVKEGLEAGQSFVFIGNDYPIVNAACKLIGTVDDDAFVDPAPSKPGKITLIRGPRWLSVMHWLFAYKFGRNEKKLWHLSTGGQPYSSREVDVSVARNLFAMLDEIFLALHADEREAKTPHGTFRLVDPLRFNSKGY